MPPAPSDGERSSLPTSGSLGRDAMAAMTFLNTVESPKKPSNAPPPRALSPPRQQKSSFALSKTAAERRARADEAERHRDATYREPGLGGRRGKRGMRPAGKWDGSSEDEDDEPEDEEEEEFESGAQASAQRRLIQQLDSAITRSSDQTTSENHANLGRGAPPRPLPEPGQPQRRASRNLPTIPGLNRDINSGMRAISVAGTEHLTDHRQWQEPGTPSGETELHPIRYNPLSSATASKRRLYRLSVRLPGIQYGSRAWMPIILVSTLLRKPMANL